MYTIIAVTNRGREFAYSMPRAYRVSKKNADIICNTLNDVGYKLESEREYWKVYHVDNYEIITSNAHFQAATIRNNKIKFENRGL